MEDLTVVYIEVLFKSFTPGVSPKRVVRNV